MAWVTAAPADPELASALWEAAPWPARPARRAPLPGQAGPRVVAALGIVARASTDAAMQEGASRALLALWRDGPPLPGLDRALRAAARATGSDPLRREIATAVSSGRRR